MERLERHVVKKQKNILQMHHKSRMIFLFLMEDFCFLLLIHFILLFPIGPYGARSHLTILRYSRADACLVWVSPDSLMLGWNIAARLMFVCLFRPHSDEVRRNSAQAHHDLSELRPGSLQTHEVSRLPAIFAFFLCVSLSVLLFCREGGKKSTSFLYPVEPV